MPVPRLNHIELPPFGDVYLPRGGEGQIANLASEVKEYFDAGIELRDRKSTRLNSSH